MESAKKTEERILKALEITKEPAPKARLLYALITPQGIRNLDE